MKTNVLQAKKALVTLFAMLMPLLASAQTEVEIDGIWYNLVSETQQAEVTNGDTKYSGSITLPATVTHNGTQYSVTSIGDYAFYGCSSLIDITIPEGVTSIGLRTFYGCSSLKSITLPESVMSIGDHAFINCSSLIDITIPKGVTNIGDNVFAGCSSLTAIVVAEGNPKYDSRDGCDAIIETNSNTLITGCSATIIPESVTTIGDNAFYGCYSLTAITIPEGVTSIGNDAFWRCNNLAAITIPESVTSIGTNAFAYCSSLKSITIPESVTSIEGGAFSSCSSLTDITIPEGVTSIGSSAFKGCSSLKSITLPKSVTSIGSWAFWNCESLQNMYCYAESVPSIGSFGFGSLENATLHVPSNAVESYKSTAPWSSFGKIESIKVPVSEITFSHTSVTLTEGVSLTLSATVTPDDASDPSVTWSSSDEDVAMVSSKGRVITLAPGTVTITATANDGSGVSASCEVRVVVDKCDVPTISYVDGEFVLTCSTEGAEIKTNVTTDNNNEYIGTTFEFVPIHTFTAYATKENYEDSDVATLTLCWIPCTEEHESEEDGILNIPSKPVLISTQGGAITLSGLAADTEVAAYSTAGTLLATATATDGTATLTTSLEAGNIAIVKMGDYSIRIAIK